MAGNSFGKQLILTTFGESHGPAIGGILDGFPAGVEIDTDFIDKQMARRRPGQSGVTTPRIEFDKVEILSGIFEGKSLGTPIGFIIKNSDTRASDYSKIKNTYRPSHADFTYDRKYGLRDYRGGGRSSARETAVRVAAGAIAMQLLNKLGVAIHAYTSSIGTISISEKPVDLSGTEQSPVRCPDPVVSEKMEMLIRKTADDGDTLGGTVTCSITGVPAGWGEPVFDKLNADLGKAMLSINAVKGFELGGGFAMTGKKGSEVNDTYIVKEGKTHTVTNFSGGIQGGISNGEEIYFRVAFKPVATLMKPQKTLDTDGNETVLEPKGRHDVCVVPRAVPIVEAMAALVLTDHYLRNRSAKF